MTETQEQKDNYLWVPVVVILLLLLIWMVWRFYTPYYPEEWITYANCTGINC